VNFQKFFPSVSNCNQISYNGSMETLNTQSFKKAISEGITIIDFYAPWCGPCIGFAPVFEKFSEEFVNKAKFYKVDIDASPEIAREYAIRSIPTILAFSDGGEILRKLGAGNAIDFRIWLNKVFAL